MSDITIGVCFSDDTAQKTQTARQKKRLRKKMRHLEQNRYKEGKYKRSQHRGQFRHNRTPQHNGESSQRPPPPASTHNAKSLPRPGSAAHCSSGPPAPAHSLPPRTFTVNSKDDSNEKPKEPANANSATPGPSGPSSHKPAAPSAAFPTKYLAIDCEMVGGGPKGSISLLARCSIVSYEGDVVYDKFIKPSMPVTDYRTRWSGIRHRDLANATSYSEAQKEILKLLKGKVVIGHAIHNDFKALGYTHPAALTRDTSRIPLLNRKAGFAENDCASLKRLTKAIFDRNIQTGRKGHSSVEDARATMELYKVVEAEWERKLASTSQAS